jgi:hypothetical protein
MLSSLQDRGMTKPPLPTVADGALEFWTDLDEASLEAHQQRHRSHGTLNALTSLAGGSAPESARPSTPSPRPPTSSPALSCASRRVGRRRLPGARLERLHDPLRLLQRSTGRTSVPAAASTTSSPRSNCTPKLPSAFASEITCSECCSSCLCAAHQMAQDHRF